MTTSNPTLRAPWFGSLLIAAATAVGCAHETKIAEEEVAVADTSEALTQEEFDCEKAKRECQIAANCDAGMRDACETAFKACVDPLRDERKTVREQCRA